MRMHVNIYAHMWNYLRMKLPAVSSVSFVIDSFLYETLKVNSPFNSTSLTAIQIWINSKF